MRLVIANDSFLRWAVPLAVIFFAVQIFLSSQLDQWVHPEPFEASQAGELDQKIVSSLRAMAFISGYKVLIGHAFWIRVLQYYGDGANSVDRFAKLYDYCRLESDLSPQFLPVYTYGASVLAYQVGRMDEAVKLLHKGILANPKADNLKLMLAAMAYHNNGNYEKEIPFLELQIAQGNAPSMMVNILANVYEKAGRMDDAINLWHRILKTTTSDVQKYQATLGLKKIYDFEKKNSSIKSKS